MNPVTSKLADRALVALHHHRVTCAAGRAPRPAVGLWRALAYPKPPVPDPAIS
jgi:hypothetical protein